MCVCVCRRIKMQYERLYQEMKDIAVAGLIQKRPKMKASRSLPAIGLGAKHTPRPRVRAVTSSFSFFSNVPTVVKNKQSVERVNCSLLH